MSKSVDPRLDKFKAKMETTIEAYRKELSGIRAGRAAVSLLEPIKVEAYGGILPISQLGTVSSPDARLLTVQVWDKGLTKHVEKAIRESGTNLNPVSEGQLIRVPIPPLSAERRQELSKLAAKYAEDARVATRNIRREAMDFAKSLEKLGEISEDELHRLSDAIQVLTDEYISCIDTYLESKQKDITQI
jgi:ribosome recycling factor